jgi:CHAT domain
MHAALVQAGATLGRCFLDDAAGEALADEIAAATEGGAAVRLAVDVPDARLAGLPWEALVLPGQTVPLALQDRVDMYRAVALEHPPSAIQVRGPLRILAVIASPALAPRPRTTVPDPGNADADRRGDAGNSEADVADGDTGAADGELAVTGNETAAVETAEALEGLARELLSRGVPAVVAMTAPVTDRYATRFAAAAYQQLATREEPVPLAAVSDARRVVEAARRA